MIFLNTTEQTLRIILGREDIKIKSVRTQETLKNLQGCSAILDILYFLPLRRNMSDSIQTNTTERLTPCLQKKIDKTTYLVEVHFSSASTQSVTDQLKLEPVLHRPQSF